MSKRERLEIIKDILIIIQNNKNSIRITPLIRKSNLSSSRFKQYFNELLEKRFIKIIRNSKKEKIISLTDKGSNFLNKYKTIVNFIEEFEL